MSRRERKLPAAVTHNIFNHLILYQIPSTNYDSSASMTLSTTPLDTFLDTAITAESMKAFGYCITVYSWASNVSRQINIQAGYRLWNTGLTGLNVGESAYSLLTSHV